MRGRLSAVVLVAAAATAVQLGAGAQTASAACPEAAVLNGVVYYGGPAPDGLRLGREVRGGVIPGCNDSVHIDENGQRVGEPERDTPVRMRRIRDVAAQIAVTVPDRPGRIFLAVGFLLELRSHPLHRELSSGQQHDRTRCGAREVRKGPLRWTPGWGVRFAIGDTDRAKDIEVDRLTRVEGAPRVQGTPRFTRGDRLTVHGRRCGQSFVADRIRVDAG
ncbi:MAG TPA: hypothetical protein VGW10_07150 [Solirubrobacteraceae bacterium]|nr:hypothetical protein [Solirubrobacteraceae bacterium]